jgi:isopentenyl-diphosphate delta-isomerase
MFLTGCNDLSKLKSAPLVISGSTRVWLEERGYDTRKFSIYRELAK